MSRMELSATKVQAGCRESALGEPGGVKEMPGDGEPRQNALESFDDDLYEAFTQGQLSQMELSEVYATQRLLAERGLLKTLDEETK